MSEVARVIKLYNMVRDRKVPSVAHITEKLEVSKSTAMRYLNVLRVELNLPIEFDRRQGGYFLDKNSRRVGPKEEIPEPNIDRSTSI